MLTDTDIADMLQAATDAVPHEMCGLLFRGKGFYRATNVAANPEHDFEMTHAEFLSALKQCGEDPWAIVHSHPTKGAHGSVKDYRLMDALSIARVPLLMVIVGLNPKEIRIYEKHDRIYQMIYFQGAETLCAPART